MKQHRATAAYIDIQSLKHNFSFCRQLMEGEFLCPMVKANAYGHGDIEVAMALQEAGAEALGVGLIEEGEILRNNGVKVDLLVFGSFESCDLPAVLKNRLTAVVSSWEQLRMLDQELNVPLNIHLKFDTGMHRLGFSVGESEEVAKFLDGHSYLKVRGVLTHLLRSDDLLDEKGASQKQLVEFEKVRPFLNIFNPVYHAFNSGGLLLKSDYSKANSKNKYGARPGLVIYGVSPFGTSDENLHPVMSLRSKTVRYHLVKAGDSVSYNATWTAKRDSIIGVVPIGYADGYHRLLSNRGQVLYDGVRCPVVGNVCMDYIMVDVTNAVGSNQVNSLGHKEVTLFGKDSKGNYLSPVELAQAAQTIAWEILTSVGERVPRIFV